MKYFITVFLLLVYVSLYSQEKTISVFGVPMGSSFEEAERILDQRFFKKDSEGKSILRYYDVPFGNIGNTNLSLSFSEGIYGGTSLNSVQIGKRYEKKAEAINAREDCVKLLSQKYPSIKSEMVDGYKLYRFGLYKNQPDITVGFIQIVETDASITGKPFYILVIRYAPTKRKPIDDI